MKEPCKTCPEKEKDLGGCRCQAYMLAGDPTLADPIWIKVLIITSLNKLLKMLKTFHLKKNRLFFEQIVSPKTDYREKCW